MRICKVLSDNSGINCLKGKKSWTFFRTLIINVDFTTIIKMRKEGTCTDAFQKKIT